MLTYDALPDKVKENYKRNITTSVAFVKKDGTVRHMAFRRNIKAYEPSTAEKTDAQLNVLQNNNLMNVVDTNAYIRAFKEFEGDSAAASKKAFRNFKLENVLAFMASGQVFDMREENNILERFGEEVYGQLTKNMISALSSDEMESAKLDDIVSSSTDDVADINEYALEEEIDWKDELDAYKPEDGPSDDNVEQPEDGPSDEEIDAMADAENEKHAIKNYDDIESGAIYEELNRMKRLISF